MSDNDRRTFSSDRRRPAFQPDPEMIRQCAGTAEFYGVNLGPLGEDAIRRILVTAKAWQDRQDALEMQHARLRDRVDSWSTERSREKAQEHLDMLTLGDTHSSDLDPGTGRP